MIRGDEPLAEAYPVVVIGGGSVGLSLAAELGWRGIECLVVEERDGLNDHPRANAVANRTMEYYRRWGIDDAISNAGIPPNLSAEYLWVTSLHGREIHRVSLPPYDHLVANRKLGAYAEDEHHWSPYLKTITGQNEVENAILDYVEGLPTVDFRFGWRLLDFTDPGETNPGNASPAGGVVRCRLEHLTTGRIETVEAAYLAGCDGGRSTVRRMLGIDYEGTAGLASFVSVYFRAPEMIDKHSFGHGNIFFPLHRDHRGFLLTWDDDKTYTYHLVLDENQAWTDIDPVAAIHGVVGAEFDVEILGVQPWVAHALVAERYVQGRVVLVGDAAHLFSPTGGFGMNTGVSDAIDLAWKLEASLHGWAGPRLLGSYDRERRPIGHRNTEEAAECFHQLYGVMQNGDEIDADGPEGEAIRAELYADIKAQEKLIASSGTLLGYRYEGSDIVVADSTPEPADDPRRYLPVARPGHRAPHVWLDDGDALYDRFGPGFNLLQLRAGPGAEAGVEAEAIDDFVQAAAAIGLPLTVVRVDEPLVRQVYEADLVLVRPDLMVAWRCEAASDRVDPATILDIVRGA